MKGYSSKIFGKNENVVVLATDHRYFGVVAGLERPDDVIKPLLEYVDVLMTSPGVLRNFINKNSIKSPVILRASGCTSTMPIDIPGYLQEPAKLAYKKLTGKDFDSVYQKYEKLIKLGKATQKQLKEFSYLDGMIHEPDSIANERLILEADGAKKEGAAGVAVSAYLKTAYQTQTLDNVATMSREARKIEMPVLGVVAVGDALGYLEKDSDFLTRAGAMLVEHGADMVKTYNCGQGFERVVQACGVPVIVAGGRLPKGRDAALDSLELAYDSLEKGAKGIDFGRRVWRHEYPVPMIKALREVVHKGTMPGDAYKKFKNFVEEEMDIEH